MSAALVPKQDSPDLDVDRAGSFEVLNLDTGLTQVFGPDENGVTRIPAGRYKPTRIYRVPEGYECHVLDNEPPVRIEDIQE